MSVKESQTIHTYCCLFTVHTCAITWYQWLKETFKFDEISTGNTRTTTHLSIDDKAMNIKWYIDTLFAVHKGMRIHTGSFMTMGRGVNLSKSSKKKLNMNSLTEAKLIVVDDFLIQVICTRYFLESRGYKIHNNIIYQDNQSSIKLENNWRKFSSK